MNYIETINWVNNLLSENKEWESRYKKYTININRKKKKHLEGRKKFRVVTPLYLYSSVSRISQYDLRFLGQSIANIKIKGEDVLISTDEKDKKNLKYFDVDIQLKNENWNSYKSRKFRSEFKNCTIKTGKSPEHKIESGLLSEFKSKNRFRKGLYNIRPVRLASTFFQMPTPLKASSGKEISYANQYGGGIDILARVKHKDNSVKLCVMELKDEYNKSEPPEKVMKQAVGYATFIANLLRSKSGNEWYNLFGFSGNVPKKITIDVSTVMPYPEIDKFKSFNNEPIEVLENTFIELYSLYFKETTEHNELYNYTFEGSLKDVMMK